MKTETERLENKWYQQLEDAGTKMTAEELLHIMREDAELILLKHGMEQPPSQSHRANRLLQEIIDEIHSMVKSKHPLDDDLTNLFRDRDMLKDFLAVHRTVYILEGRPL